MTLDGELFPLSFLDEYTRNGFEPGETVTFLLPAGRLQAELVERGRVLARTAPDERPILPGEHRRIVLEPR